MSKLPITCIITTYDRGDWVRANMLLEQLKNFNENLIYSNLRFIVTDDGSPNHDEIGEKVLALADEYEWALSYLNTERKGVGYAKNNALREAFKISPIVLLTEDDWIWNKPIDLLTHVQLMLDHPEIGMVRFGFLGGDITADLKDYGTWMCLTYWKLRRGSGVYVYSGQISLRGKNFYDKVGWHKEGVSAAEEEIDMCFRYNACDDAPDILWDARESCFLNCGFTTNIGLNYSVKDIAL